MITLKYLPYLDNKVELLYLSRLFIQYKLYMENGNGKDRGDGAEIIQANFNTQGRSDTVIKKDIADNIRSVSDLINDHLARPAELAAASSMPPKAPEGKVIKFKKAPRKRSARTDFSNRRKRAGAKTIKFNDLLMRENTAPVIDSISGGQRQQVNPENAAAEDKAAKQKGYSGVRRVYLLIKNTLPEHDFSPALSIDAGQREAQLAAGIQKAVQELQEIHSARDENDELIFSTDPRDPRLFNAVASILIRVWPHNYKQRLNDLRVNTIVLLLTQGDVSWRKLIDLMVEWEKMPPQSPAGKWSR